MRKFLNSYFIGVITLVLAISFTACGDDDDDDNNNNPAEKSVFTVISEDKSYHYIQNISSTKTDYLSGTKAAFQVMVIEGVSAGNDYGVFNGGALTLSYYLQGDGEYDIVESNTQFVAVPGTKTLQINLVVGSGNSNYSRLYNMPKGKATVKVVDEKYHITIKNAVLGKVAVTMGEGSGLPESVSLTINDAHDTSK